MRMRREVWALTCPSRSPAPQAPGCGYWRCDGERPAGCAVERGTRRTPPRAQRRLQPAFAIPITRRILGALPKLPVRYRRRTSPGRKSIKPGSAGAQGPAQQQRRAGSPRPAWAGTPALGGAGRGGRAARTPHFCPGLRPLYVHL